MSVIEAFKHITSKINSMVKDMDNKLDNFSEEILNIMSEYNPDFFSNSDDIDKDKELLKEKVKSVFNVFKPEKKSLNGYMIYCKENRERIVSDNPSLKVPDITKALSKEWNDLEDSEKNIYRAKTVKPSSTDNKKRGRSKSVKREKKEEPKKKEEVVTNKTLLLQKIKETEKRAKEYERALTPKSSKKSPIEIIKVKPKVYSKHKNYWTTTPTTIEGKKVNLHKETGLILKGTTVTGMYLYNDYVDVDDMDEDMKEWVRMCEFTIEGEEICVELYDD